MRVPVVRCAPRCSLGSRCVPVAPLRQRPYSAMGSHPVVAPLPAGLPPCPRCMNGPIAHNGVPCCRGPVALWGLIASPLRIGVPLCLLCMNGPIARNGVPRYHGPIALWGSRMSPLQDVPIVHNRVCCVPVALWGLIVSLSHECPYSSQWGPTLPWPHCTVGFHYVPMSPLHFGVASCPYCMMSHSAQWGPIPLLFGVP